MKKTALVAYLFATGLVMFLIGCTTGQKDRVPKNTLATAQETVRAFCDLDADGVRLKSETWSRILPYIAWTEEAGWDRTAVIEGYRIVKSDNTSEKLELVTVEYQIAGNLSQDYMPAKQMETVIFTVQKTGDGWKIKDPDFMPPHVLMQPVIRHLRETRRLELVDKIK
ncbi:MAG: hypothetical protein OEW15_06915 [Nitrospirota bacterium]|nr:hypothetical protein [Nitrospirota bacterium]